MQFKTITIIGIGLIGGSIAHDLKEKKLVNKIIGIDTQSENLRIAKQKKIIDIALSSINQVSLDVDIVIIATPVSMIFEVLQLIGQFQLKPNTIITDVASTKRSVLEAYQYYLPDHYSYCVAAHPVAGCEKSGVNNIIPYLFNQQKIIICPHELQNAQSIQTIKRLWELLESQIYIMPAEVHDQIFAMTSHFPHILAYAFMNQLNNDVFKEKYLNFAGTGFRDFTRIAGSDSEMWSGICVENQDFLLLLLEHYFSELEVIKNLLESKDKDQLKSYFSTSQQLRQVWENNKI
ncbi:MAG: prephenate dehydrogenase/arogenate dehydrogenase family protein [Neisseriaceae bacterium]|nr:MAG: prephenate dehydrogenase/arogenate dehydrogenase family protein [Neisseriaceae bacterium]